MTTKAIKISEENYRMLVEKSSEMSREEGRPVSLDKALGATLRGTNKRKTMLDLAELKDEKELIAALENAYRESRKDRGRTW